MLKPKPGDKVLCIVGWNQPKGGYFSNGIEMDVSEGKIYTIRKTSKLDPREVFIEGVVITRPNETQEAEIGFAPWSSWFMRVDDLIKEE